MLHDVKWDSFDSHCLNLLCHILCTFDVGFLRTFIAATKQKNDCPAPYREVQPVSLPHVNPHLRDASANWPDISQRSRFGSVNAAGNRQPRAKVAQSEMPSPENFRLVYLVGHGLLYPCGYVIVNHLNNHTRKLNLARRHMTQEQRRELIREQLTETPEKSDRQIAAGLNADNSTVSRIRDKMEQAGELLQYNTSTGADGKEYPRQVFRKPVTIFNPTPAEERAIQNPAVLERMAADEIPATAAIREIKRQEIIAKLEDISRLLDGSAEYQAIQQRIRDEANKARSEAQAGNQNATKEKTVVPQCEARLLKPNRTTDAKAALIGVSRPAVERAAFIQAKDPVLAGQLSPFYGLAIASPASLPSDLVRQAKRQGKGDRFRRAIFHLPLQSWRHFRVWHAQTTHEALPVPLQLLLSFFSPFFLLKRSHDQRQNQGRLENGPQCPLF